MVPHVKYKKRTCYFIIEQTSKSFSDKFDKCLYFVFLVLDFKYVLLNWFHTDSETVHSQGKSESKDGNQKPLSLEYMFIDNTVVSHPDILRQLWYSGKALGHCAFRIALFCGRWFESVYRHFFFPHFLSDYFFKFVTLPHVG